MVFGPELFALPGISIFYFHILGEFNLQYIWKNENLIPKKQIFHMRFNVQRSQLKLGKNCFIQNPINNFLQKKF